MVSTAMDRASVKIIALVSALFLLAEISSAFEDQTPLVLKDPHKKESARFLKEGGWIMSINCKDKPCEARLAASKARGTSVSAEENKSYSNTVIPAAAYFCKKLGGQNIILEDKNLNQYDFCRFTDTSSIQTSNLWNLRKK